MSRSCPAENTSFDKLLHCCYNHRPEERFSLCDCPAQLRRPGTMGQASKSADALPRKWRCPAVDKRGLGALSSCSLVHWTLQVVVMAGSALPLEL